MESLGDIFDRYWHCSVRPPTMGYVAPVLAPLDAMRFLVDCLENGHTLLGVSGFNYLESEFIQPEQRFEMDRAECGSTREFLGRVAQMLMGEFGRSVVFELAFDG